MGRYNSPTLAAATAALVLVASIVGLRSDSTSVDETAELDRLMDSATPEPERGDLPDLARLRSYRTIAAERLKLVADIRTMWYRLYVIEKQIEINEVAGYPVVVVLEEGRRLVEIMGGHYVAAGMSGAMDHTSGHGPWPEGLMRLGWFLKQIRKEGSRLTGGGRSARRN